MSLEAATVVDSPDTDIVTENTAAEPKPDNKPTAFMRSCVGQNAKNENTLSAIGRLANVVANAKGESADKLRDALRFLAEGGIDSRVKGGKTIRDILTTSTGTFKASELLKVIG